MKTSVVEKDYQDLQKAIMSLQEKWKGSLPEAAVQPKIDQAALKEGVPVAAFTHFHFDISLFLQWLDELTALLIQSNPALAEKLSKVQLNEVTAQKWMEEALAFNQPYFLEFANAHGIEEWIPPFLAETTIRPYLQRTAEMVQEHITVAKPGSGCPVCGEPARVAALEEDGRKIHHCPRCQAHWHAKRLECSHCGNQNHEKMNFLTIEGDAANQIQVCEECNGYIKVIDTRQYITKPTAAMLDLNSLHLDFVAQENGYQAVGTKKQSN